MSDLWLSHKTAILLVLIFFTSLLSAQETITHGSVGGRVTDPSGAVVVGASVSARQIETNRISQTVTDQEGRFRFPYLKVGRYEITFRHQGFSDVVQPVD